MTDNKYFYGYNEETAHFWHWYNILSDKLTGRITIENLPDSIDPDFLIRRLLLDGRIAFFKDKGELIAYPYHSIGVFDKYGKDTKINVVFRYGNKQEKNEYTVNKDCVLVFAKPSIKLHRGVGFVSEICRTADILSNIDLTFKIRLENDRLTALADVISDSDISAVNDVFNKMSKGQRVIAVKSSIIDNIHINPLTQTTNATKITEYSQLIQYYIAEFYNNIGISALMSSKKERMITDELTANDEVVEYAFKQTINTIQKGIEEVNAKFDTNIIINFIDIHNDEEMKESEENEDNVTAKATGESEETERNVTKNEEREEPNTDNENETSMHDDVEQIEITSENITIETENIEIIERGENNDD